MNGSLCVSGRLRASSLVHFWAQEAEDANGHKTYPEHDGLGRVTRTARDLGGSEEIETVVCRESTSGLTEA